MTSPSLDVGRLLYHSEKNRMIFYVDVDPSTLIDLSNRINIPKKKKLESQHLRGYKSTNLMLLLVVFKLWF